MTVAGVDGTKKGWIAVILDGGQVTSISRLEKIDSDFAELGEVEIVAIDIPIGFGPRRADGEARAKVGGSFVFPIPDEAKFAEPFGPGRAISAQAFALGDRIRHVTDLARRDSRFREVHPEVCFWAMNGNRKLANGKKTAGGVLERMALLEAHGLQVRRDALDDAARVPLDDVLDAAACAWTASRIADGTGVSLPDPPEERGDLHVAIWC